MYKMRDLVTRKTYRLRKIIDDFLFWLLPNRWVPLYNSVSFTHMPYKQCIANRKWQDKVCNYKHLKAYLLTIYAISSTRRNSIYFNFILQILARSLVGLSIAVTVSTAFAAYKYLL